MISRISEMSHLRCALPRTRLVPFFLLLGVAFAVSTADAATYYVDTAASNASDSNPGSASSPWKTLQKAAATLVAGDRAIIRAGTYAGRLSPANSGNSSAYIYFEAQPGVVIDGGEIWIERKSHIEISGFKVQRTPHAGISVFGSGVSFIRIRNNYTWNTGGSGISIWGRPWDYDPAECNYACVTDVLIEGNRIERANNPAQDGGGYNEHLTVASGVARVTIRNNILTAGPPTGDPIVDRPGGEGIDLKEGVTDAYVYDNEITDMVKCRYGIYIDAGGSTWGYPNTYKTVPGWLRNIHVYRNKVLRNDSHGIGVVSEGSGNLENVYVYNNLVAGQGREGMIVYDWELPDRPNPPNPLPVARNIHFFNNTVYDNGKLDQTFGGIAFDHGFATNVTVRNNISFNHSQNIRMRLVPPGTVINTNLTTDPKFVNAAAFDFRLQSTSPAIDAGASDLPIPLTNDFAGSSRPVNNRYDIGAYEYGNQDGLRYVSDVTFLSATNGWGPVERDKANGDQASGDGATIRLKGRSYSKGIGVHASSDIEVDLAGRCSSFLSDIGVDDEVAGATDGATVVFKVFADGALIYDSGLMNRTTATKSLSLNVAGKSTLRMSVSDGGDGIGSDHADWADARIICGSASNAPRPPTNMRTP